VEKLSEVTYQKGRKFKGGEVGTQGRGFVREEGVQEKVGREGGTGRISY